MYQPILKNMPKYFFDFLITFHNLSLIINQTNF